MNLHRIAQQVIHLVIAVALTAGALLFRPATSVSAARTFYVSRNGNNGDGLSWNTAWNELSRINWGAVAAGDTILVDGGALACPALGPGYNCGMVYNSTLSIGKSGSNGAPITIRLANEPGRNGTAIIDGGITSWSRCAEYPSENRPPSTPNGAGTRQTGIEVNNAQWVVIDGTKWGGFEVRNHTRYGLNLGGSQNVLARYLKIHHNTDPSDSSNNAVGITQNWRSQRNTVSRVEVFRNGQDAVRGAGDFFTLEESYIHDHYCNHPDGIQSFVPTNNSDVPDNEGEVRGLVVRRNVFDKIGMQTIFLGENASHNSWNVDVTIHDNLLLNNDYVIKSKHGSSRNWNIYNNTIVNAGEFAVEWCCASPGARAPMTVNNNIFMNVKNGSTAFYMPTGGGNTTFSGNCLYQTGRRSGNISESGTVTGDPRFINSSLGNFGLASGSACSGKGASITSVNQLLSLTGGASVPPVQPTSPPPATATRVPPTATSVRPTATGVGPTATSVPPTATSVPPTGSTNLTFGPAADAHVDNGSPDSNFGASGVVRTLANPAQRSYLRFNVAGVAGRTVTRAVLRIYANGSSPSGFQVQKVDDNSWSEMGVTYNNRPRTSGQIASTGAHTYGVWLTVDVTSYINRDGTFTLALLTDSTKPVSYPSREGASNRPELILTVAGTVQPAATQVPPTNVPPTTVPPTNVPPTTVPPTATSIPPTNVPPTTVPPTAVVPSGPETLTFGPAADAHVDNGSPDSNFGASGVVRTLANPAQRTYLRFDVVGVAGRPVTRAELRIYANGSSPSGFQVQKVDDNSWSEMGVTYNNRPITSGQIATVGAHRHGVWLTVDVTSYINRDGTFTLALLTDSTKPVSYPSREGDSNQPQLVLTVGN